MNNQRLIAMCIRHEMYKKKAKEEYLILRNDPLFVSGLSLYWGEGDKSGRKRVALINTDPLLLKVTVLFYKKILKIPSDKIKAALFIYSDINEESALTYWSNTLEIPLSNFIKTQKLSSRSTYTKRKVKYGMCNVYFSSIEMSIKITEWLFLLARDLRE
ncbi:MAG: hypothetical protein ACD_37C00012G0003 [uncultured bacterium]|nr:MAG: hypothetical protein ACD_37C00012G0003 [uncultured bacterium]